jgi:hypothetical protein
MEMLNEENTVSLLTPVRDVKGMYDASKENKNALLKGNTAV